MVLGSLEEVKIGREVYGFGKLVGRRFLVTISSFLSFGEKIKDIF